MSGAEAWRADAEALRAAPPRHVLFLCVANSARSQMAEGIARTLAPPDVRVSSAGSRPSTVNPFAIRSLDEIGIDLGGHRSKGVGEIDLTGIDTVITLCAEEVCPVFLGNARRFHWALPDPAGAGATEAEQLGAFRTVRDELRRRLRTVFPARGVEDVRYCRATSDDVPALRRLLASVRLPADDVWSPHQTFTVARLAGEVVGCIGLEQYGADGLLRSLAVAPPLQGAGVGRALHARALDEARRSGVERVYLLTMTAAAWCARIGFEPVDRGSVPATVARSQEFRSLCPTSALCMVRQVAT